MIPAAWKDSAEAAQVARVLLRRLIARAQQLDARIGDSQQLDYALRLAEGKDRETEALTGAQASLYAWLTTELPEFVEAIQEIVAQIDPMTALAQAALAGYEPPQPPQEPPVEEPAE